MKTKKISLFYLIAFLFAGVFFLSSCKKENSVSGIQGTSSISSEQAIPVGISTATNDSIYVIGACSHNHLLDSIAESTLPSTIVAYLGTTYSGYTFKKAFVEKDYSGNITGFVVIINYNGNPVGIKFDASGNFVQVLEQREGRDMEGRGYHEGGCFSNRDGMHKDTISLSSLPSSIISYLNTNYPQDTLVRAYRNCDSSYIVFSIDNGSFATIFNSSGVFVKRVELHNEKNRPMVLSESALPAAVQSYLTTTYPNYVFEQAFSFTKNGTLLGYVVVIDANNTKYAVQFDASGNFVGAITLW